MEKQISPITVSLNSLEKASTTISFYRKQLHADSKQGRCEKASPLQTLYRSVTVRWCRGVWMFFVQGIPVPQRSFARSGVGRTMG